MKKSPIFMDLLIFLYFGICLVCVYLCGGWIHVQMYIIWIYLFTLCPCQNNVCFSLLVAAVCKNHMQTETVLKKSLCVYSYLVVYGTINWLVYSQTEESSIFTYSYENEIISPILIFLVTKLVPFSRYVIKYNYKIIRYDIL